MPQKNIDKVIQVEANRLLYSPLSIGLIVILITSAALVFGFETSTNQNQKIIWWLIMVILVAFRFILGRKYKRRISKEPKYDLYLFSLGAIATALMWSFYTLYFYEQASDLELTVTMVIVASFASGSASILSANKPLSITYIIILVLPYSVLLAFSMVPAYQTLGCLGFFFLMSIVLSAYKSAEFTKDAIAIKHQHDQLLSEMERKVEERTQAYITLSNSDALTGLLNRKAFLETLNALIVEKSEQELAILFIDLDGFKGVNDTLGHEMGDRVINIAASRIKNFSIDSLIVSRWGGDEFLVVLRHESKQRTLDFAKGLIKEMSAPYFENIYHVTIGATIGVSLYPEHSRRKEELIQHADMAMYQQKRLVKGDVGYFDEALRLQLHREFTLRDQLATCLERNELRLVYQPIINTKTGSVVAFEALLRWDSILGAIPPDQFIPIAEQYGQIKSIGLWVLDQACQQAKVFRTISSNMCICVNVSVAQFQDGDFAGYIAEIFKKYDFDPSGLHIEITESFFASDKESLIKQIKALQEMNIQISIDDFGTGYSSLSSMQDMGVDIVKIDKSFVHTVQGSGLSIITAVLLIANELDYKVVAEGVETEEQANILRGLNVPYLQGYYFSRPMESEQALEYLAS